MHYTGAMLTASDTATLFVPPHPPVPTAELPLLRFLRAIRSNALTMWTDAAYQEDFLVRRMLGRSNILINAPDAIHRVLVDNPGNYRRSPASIRILRPITGKGLLLSEGDDWRHQRRTIAPALAPRVMPMLARHIVTCTQEALIPLQAQAGEPVDLLAAMQNLALDIAGPFDVLAGDAAIRRGDATTAHRVRHALRTAASVRHGAAAVDPDAARPRPPAVPARLDGV